MSYLSLSNNFPLGLTFLSLMEETKAVNHYQSKSYVFEKSEPLLKPF